MGSRRKPIAAPKNGVVADQQSVREPTSDRYTAFQAQTKANVVGHHLVQKVTGVRSGSREKILTRIKKGLKYSAISQLEAALQTTQKEIAQILSIPPTTLQRRKRAGLLLTDESDRVVRLASLKDAALAMMQGDDDAAVAWLHTPLDILGGESPLAHASTELGARDVEDLIGRLRHGVFS